MACRNVDFLLLVMAGHLEICGKTNGFGSWSVSYSGLLNEIMTFQPGSCMWGWLQLNMLFHMVKHHYRWYNCTCYLYFLHTLYWFISLVYLSIPLQLNLYLLIPNLWIFEPFLSGNFYFQLYCSIILIRKIKSVNIIFHNYTNSRSTVHSKIK